MLSEKEETVTILSRNTYERRIYDPLREIAGDQRIWRSLFTVI